jgi:hypothetical protein
LPTHASDHDHPGGPVGHSDQVRQPARRRTAHRRGSGRPRRLPLPAKAHSWSHDRTALRLEESTRTLPPRWRARPGRFWRGARQTSSRVPRPAFVSAWGGAAGAVVLTRSSDCKRQPRRFRPYVVPASRRRRSRRQWRAAGPVLAAPRRRSTLSRSKNYPFYGSARKSLMTELITHDHALHGSRRAHWGIESLRSLS